MDIEIIKEVLIDAIKDSLLVLPFLFLTYLLIELIDRKVDFFNKGKFLSGKNAPLIGALLGAFPQCGFSVMASKFYNSGLIKCGTLLAVFISTSDEAFAILLSNGKFLTLLALIVFKIILAVIVGYLVNLIVKSTIVLKYKKLSFKHEEYCRQCGSSSKAKNKFETYIVYPLTHALKTFLFIFIINLVFNTIITLLTEEVIISFMLKSKIFQPFLVGVVGLIPNCASSILITQLYLRGGMSFGSMFAGLSTNAGIGLAILLKNKSKIKGNLILILVLYIVSVLSGFALNLIF